MQRILGTLTALTFFAIASFANADEVSGRITAMDADSGTILLEDGSMYTLGEGVSIDGLEPGTEVTVSYEEQEGQKVATEVTPAQ